MDFVFPLVAFLATFLASSWSLGSGLLTVLAVGYVSGIIRANFLGVFTTFMFDAALLALYLRFFGRSPGYRFPSRVGLARVIIIPLVGWPVFLSLLPVNHFFIQCIALRATVWFLPVFFVASQLAANDLALMTRGLTVLNLIALAGGLYVYFYGVESLYPVNSVTQIIYRSKDLGGGKYYRVPSLFLNAHAYGGTMLSTLPFLLDRLLGVGVRWTDRWFSLLGMLAALSGILMCGARSPVIVFGLMLILFWILNRFSLQIGLAGAFLVGAALIFSSASDRLQRASTLNDTELVSNRLAGSANATFLELLLNYPLGAGMGSSAGTSIPYFLASEAPEPIGLENEFSRILVDQGWVGLCGWLFLLGWLLGRPPSARPLAPWRVGALAMYALVLANWLTAVIGTGILSSVPGSVLLLTQMGIIAPVRAAGRLPEEATSRPGDSR